MKKLLFILLMCVMASLSIAQVSEPEYVGQVLLLTSDSTTILLDKEAWTTKSKSSHYGMIPIPGSSLLDKTKMLTIIKGNESKVSVPAGQVRFIIKASDNNLDPTSILGIYKFEAKKKTRERKTGEVSLLTGASLSVGGTDVQFKAVKYGKSSYLVEAVLEPGEYAIDIVGNNAMMSTFHTTE